MVSMDVNHCLLLYLGVNGGGGGGGGMLRKLISCNLKEWEHGLFVQWSVYLARFMPDHLISSTG